MRVKDPNSKQVNDEETSLSYDSGVDDEKDEKVKIDETRTDIFKLLWGAGGIYVVYIYYGSVQEDVFRYEDANGVKFTQAWFLQVLEAAANVVVGQIGWRVVGGTRNLPMKDFMISGASQVSAKAFTSLALAHGLSFPVATLAKSAKMAPVMVGSLILGGAVYSVRQYLQVFAIILGTAILSMSKKKGAKGHSTNLGVFFILISLVMDGIVGGTQKRLKKNMEQVGVKPTQYDFMLYTNFFMMLTALIVSVSLREFFSGLTYCAKNADVLVLILKFSCCSAIGQSFIFYTLAHFDPLVCSSITTTRKIFSVLLSICFKGHHMGVTGWCGLSIAMTGILSEARTKVMNFGKKKSVETSKFKEIANTS